MTKKQKLIYEIVKSYVSIHGHAPTIREICVISGLSSTATVYVHLKNLKEKGYIVYDSTKSRTIKIVGEQNDN